MGFVPVSPMYVNWHYNYACNFNCEHCYSRAASYPKELGRDTYLRIADEFVASGVFKVFLGGGEPLLRKDVYEVVARLRMGGLFVGLTTNGWNVDAIPYLQSSGLSLLYVSIDDSEAPLHDAQRRRAGSFDRAVETIRAAVSAGLLVKLSTVAHRKNFERLDSVVDLARSLRVDGVEFKRFRPAGNGLRRDAELSLSDTEVRDLTANVQRLDSATESLEVRFVHGSLPGGNSRQTCPCGVRSIALRPNGDVVPCIYSEQVIGNLARSELARIWRESPALTALRESGSCRAMRGDFAPANPYISIGRQPQARKEESWPRKK